MFNYFPSDRNKSRRENLKMDKNTAIIVDRVSKKYCKSLKRSMIYGIEDIARNTLGLGSHSQKLRNDEFWAVNDISFEVQKGETLGLIGPNGSGKTTLLKMLNGIFWPDKGIISLKGKVGGLIEVGAGFHPLLTGRENVYINAAILGMTKEEVDRKFNDIVEFADIGDFIDSPVKHYSSGMFVRLGFAVAVHCEPDILLVDEVLAVGDSAFRNKCYKKLDEIKKNKDVAIVFVSHDLYTVEKFCDKGLLLERGLIKSQGDINNVIRDYQYRVNQSLEKRQTDVIPDIPYSTKEVEITNVEYLDTMGKELTEIPFGGTLGIKIDYKTKHIINEPIVQIALFNSQGIRISTFGTHLYKIKINAINGEGFIECWVDNLPLLSDKFFVNVSFYDKNHEILLDYWRGSIKGSYFQVLPNNVSIKMGEYTAICHFNARWEIGQGKDIQAL